MIPSPSLYASIFSAKKFFGNNPIASSVVPYHLPILHDLLDETYLPSSVFGISGTKSSGKSFIIQTAAVCRTLKFANQTSAIQTSLPNAALIFSSSTLALRFIKSSQKLLENLNGNLPINSHPQRLELEIGNFSIFCSTPGSPNCPLTDPELLSEQKIGWCAIDDVITPNDNTAADINQLIRYAKLTPSRIVLTWNHLMQSPKTMFDVLIENYWKVKNYRLSYKDLKEILPKSCISTLRKNPY